MKRAEEHAEGACPLVYQCRLPPSTRTVNHLAGLLRRQLKAVRSRWRILPPGKIAVIVLAVLRHDQRLADMAGGNNTSESTVRRWRDEAIGSLAAQAPRLDRACKKIARQGGEVVLIDGILIPTRRRTRKADRKNYSGKHRHHGLRFLPLTDEGPPDLDIRRPAGRTHDNTAARHDHILAHLHAGRPRLDPRKQPRTLPVRRCARPRCAAENALRPVGTPECGRSGSERSDPDRPSPSRRSAHWCGLTAGHGRTLGRRG
ncbi:IS5/IS1182 family transposase [Streptomyces coeruleorubidus]|uniref:IS5/IS1182 family transposase n=1 Tax=Streptomyces coeruleorubidus TaxID=116188 RepID=UPI0036C9F2F0